MCRCSLLSIFPCFKDSITAQPLYNTVIGVQANISVLAIQTVLYGECIISYIGKSVLNDHFESNDDLCYIQKPYYKEVGCISTVFNHKLYV